MRAFNGILQVFLFPGTIALRQMHLDIEDDGGIIRSFVNMIFWGIMAFAIIMPIML